MNEIPTVDWLDLENNRNKFMDDLRYALSECGFLVLANAPGLDDAFQQRAFREVRGFFDLNAQYLVTLCYIWQLRNLFTCFSMKQTDDLRIMESLPQFDIEFNAQATF